MALGVRQDEVVHHLDRGRAVLQHQRRRAERIEQVIELDRHHRLLRRQRDQSDLRVDDEAERAFGADDDAGEIDRSRTIDEGVEVVAADAAQHFRKSPIDLRSVSKPKLGNRAIRARLDAVASPRGSGVSGIERPEMRELSVGQHDALFLHVIDGLAVEHRSRAAGVVRHHAADGGPAGR